MGVNLYLSSVFLPLCVCVCVFAGMGLGVEFSRHKRQSRGSGAVLGSTDASGNTSSQGSLSGTEEEEGVALYRAIFPFSGTTDDEVINKTDILCRIFDRVCVCVCVCVCVVAV